MIALALVLQLLAGPVPSGGMPGATPPAPGNPHFIQLVSLEGVPPDSAMHAEFEGAFRTTFAESDLPGERLTRMDAWSGGLTLPNRFRLLEGDAALDAWQLDVSIGAPHAAVGSRKKYEPDAQGHYHEVKTRTVNKRYRSSRGMIVAITMQVPDPSGRIGHSKSDAIAFYFPGTPGDGVSPAVPAAYKYPWGMAGRVAAMLVLESLHRESGDLSTNERMDIAPAIRIDPGATTGGAR